MQHSDWYSRLIHLARALCPLVVAICLTVVMPSLNRLALDPGMIDLGTSRSAESIPSLIATYAEQYALDPALLQAVIKVESDFNPQAVSSKGALGLMQLMPLTAATLHVLDPFDPDDNIRAGSALLRRLLDRFGGDLSLALAAYHAGERRVSQATSSESLPGTQLYVERVLRHYNHFVSDATLSAVWVGRSSGPTHAVSTPRQLLD
jgi:soluble lytic murein transglycosylase